MRLWIGSGMPRVLAGKSLQLDHRRPWIGSGGSNERQFSFWTDLVSSVNSGLLTGRHVGLLICVLDPKHQFRC